MCWKFCNISRSIKYGFSTWVNHTKSNILQAVSKTKFVRFFPDFGKIFMLQNDYKIWEMSSKFLQNSEIFLQNFANFCTTTPDIRLTAIWIDLSFGDNMYTTSHQAAHKIWIDNRNNSHKITHFASCLQHKIPRFCPLICQDIHVTKWLQNMENFSKNLTKFENSTAKFPNFLHHNTWYLQDCHLAWFQFQGWHGYYISPGGP